jgi:dienelactone hydrolase
LEANTYGTGPTIAIFMHEAGFRLDMCGFWPYAKWLAEHVHVRVLLFNRCTYGNSTCQVYQVGDRGIRGQVEPAVRWAQRHNAKHVVLVGASSGASDAIQAGGVVMGIDAVVALSSDKADTRTNEQHNARRLRVPTLLAVAPGDRYSPLSAVRTTFRLIGSKDKRLVVVRSAPGMHGWELVQKPDGGFTSLARTVARFVASGTNR